jgi:hypothetical protein
MFRVLCNAVGMYSASCSFRDLNRAIRYQNQLKRVPKIKQVTMSVISRKERQSTGASVFWRVVV